MSQIGSQMKNSSGNRIPVDCPGDDQLTDGSVVTNVRLNGETCHSPTYLIFSDPSHMKKFRTSCPSGESNTAGLCQRARIQLLRLNSRRYGKQTTHAL